MNDTYIEGKEFKEIDSLGKGEYEDCVFIDCNFASADLSQIEFVECEFVNCDLSLASIANTAFKVVQFKACKLVGLHFEDCNSFLFAVGFDGCQLHLSSFYKMSLKGTNFIGCRLQEVDFVETDLSNASFDDCDLSGAVFENTQLEKANFRTAFNFSIDPEKNKVSKAMFSMVGAMGLLDKYNIVIE